MTKRAWLIALAISVLILIILLLRWQQTRPLLVVSLPDPPRSAEGQARQPIRGKQITTDSKLNVAEQVVSMPSSAVKSTVVQTDGEESQRFQKMSNSGQLLPDSAGEWHCVLDASNSLIWEVKTADGGLRDQEFTYTWYQKNGSADTGELSAQIDGGDCFYIECHTAALIEAVNETGLCGSQSWRMPSHVELATLDHNANYYPDIDTQYFPNTVSREYWSSSTPENNANLAWNVDFKNGFPYVAEKRLSYHVRLVRNVDVVVP